MTDFLLDGSIVLVPLLTFGVKAPSEIRVHVGFLTCWNSVSLEITNIVSYELSSHPDYTIVTTGHSLGGALTDFAAVSLKTKFADKYAADSSGSSITS
ncbi:hypothetical protein ONZ45_g19289 [Pleurotus djamor]|nr:hypothetical protein ONZ45_g19289 [Pleurotus djamor]